ncbi:hypothetical protein AAEX63_09805 [Luteococcus sp. H138]|uniref:hypothetical protein n=1 Tax=unclassified Luteococcus TaxID=2639923 RepID=UPI00313E57A0
MTMRKGIESSSGEPMDIEHWKNIFVDEMRYRGASGRTIGEAWATVESHCVESRTNPALAFGDPLEYARSLTDSPRRWGSVFAILGAVWLGGIGLNMVVGIPWVPLARSVDVHWGSLLTVPISLILLGAMVIMQRSIQRERWQGVVGWFVTFMAWSTINTWLRGWTARAGSVPAWSLWLVCLLLLLACTAGVIGQVRDRMIDPRTGQTPSMLPAFWWWVLAFSPLWGPGALLFFRWLAHR